MKNRKEFYKTVIIFNDTREQQNSHVLAALDRLGVKHEPRKLDVGGLFFSC